MAVCVRACMPVCACPWCTCVHAPSRSPRTWSMQMRMPHSPQHRAARPQMPTSQPAHAPPTHHHNRCRDVIHGRGPRHVLPPVYAIDTAHNVGRVVCRGVPVDSSHVSLDPGAYQQTASQAWEAQACKADAEEGGPGQAVRERTACWCSCCCFLCSGG